MRTGLLFLLGAMLAIGPATAARDRVDRDAQALARELAGRGAGPPQRCVSSRVDGPMIVGQTLLYRDGRTTWRNDIANCPSLTRDPTLIVEIFGGQICEREMFRTVERGGAPMPGPFCQFGPFIPYRKPG